MTKNQTGSLTTVPHIERRILVIRGQKVMIDADLAELCGVPTKALNQAVRRNAERFPANFMFQLTAAEKTEVVTNCDHLAKLKFFDSSGFHVDRMPAYPPSPRLRGEGRGRGVRGRPTLSPALSRQRERE